MYFVLESSVQGATRVVDAVHRLSRHGSTTLDDGCCYSVLSTVYHQRSTAFIFRGMSRRCGDGLRHWLGGAAHRAHNKGTALFLASVMANATLTKLYFLWWVRGGRTQHNARTIHRGVFLGNAFRNLKAGDSKCWWRCQLPKSSFFYRTPFSVHLVVWKFGSLEQKFGTCITALKYFESPCFGSSCNPIFSRLAPSGEILPFERVRTGVVAHCATA